MKRLLLLWAVIFLPACAGAQNLSTYQAASALPSTYFLNMVGARSSTGTAVPFTLTADGSLPTTITWSGSTSDPSKLEDAPAVSADRGMFILGVQNRTGAAPSGADGDYVQFSANQFGGMKCEISSDYTDNVNKNFYRIEDNAIGSGQVGAVILTQRNDTISAGAFSDTTLDATNAVNDIHSRIYVNPWGADESEWIDGQSSVITTVASGNIIAATGSATLAWCLTAVNCTNSGAAATRVGILSNSVERWSLMLPAGGSDGQTFATPLKGVDNVPWVASVITTGSSTICSATAFKC